MLNTRLVPHGLNKRTKMEFLYLLLGLEILLIVFITVFFFRKIIKTLRKRK